MFVSFDRAVLALSESIIRERCARAEFVDPNVFAIVAGFLRDQHRRMPDYLRLPFMCVTLVFDAWSLPLTGRPFHRASLAQRSRQIRAWKGSRLGFRRDFIKFHEGLAVFAFYSERHPDAEVPQS
jgi:hypothetical protein